MCNILVLEPNQMPDKTKFFNMCYNNWHSSGLVVRVGKKLDIKKEVYTDDKEIDPEVLYQDLLKDIGFKRYFHVRHATKGSVTADNCHPFEFYFNSKTNESLLFFHNGTFYKNIFNDFSVEKDSNESDSLNFVNKFLIPYVSQTDYGSGIGDLSNTSMRELVNMMWPPKNRGLIISSDPSKQDLFLGEEDWDKIESVGENKDSIMTSNKSYFNSVTRGPVYEREQKKKIQTSNNVVRFSSLYNKTNSNSLIKYNMKNILGDSSDLWSNRDCRANMAYLKPSELESLYGLKEDFLNIFTLIIGEYSEMHEKLVSLGAYTDPMSGIFKDVSNEPL